MIFLWRNFKPHSTVFSLNSGNTSQKCFLTFFIVSLGISIHIQKKPRLTDSLTVQNINIFCSEHYFVKVKEILQYILVGKVKKRRQSSVSKINALLAHSSSTTSSLCFQHIRKASENQSLGNLGHQYDFFQQEWSQNVIDFFFSFPFGKNPLGLHEWTINGKQSFSSSLDPNHNFIL